MSLFHFNFSVSWILLLTLLFCLMQVSFPLRQDTEIHRNNAAQTENDTNDDAETNHSVSLPIEASDLDNENDSRNCFPYFIYQDIESLLNQALKMLSISKTERQRSWLQLFIRRLESLLTQLRRLPVQYVSRCYLAKEKVNPDLLTSDRSSAPEEDRLKLAKKLLFSSKARMDKKNHLNDRLKEYVTGSVFHGRSRDDEEHGTTNQKRSGMLNQSNKAHIAQKSNKDIELMPNNLKNLYDFEENSDTTADKGSSRYSNNPLTDILLPITFWEKQNMNPETMPFLPRATRKIAHPISEKMKFRAVAAHPKHADPTTEVDEQTLSEIQTRLPTPQNDYTTNTNNRHHQEEMTPTLISHPEDSNITPPTHRHYHKEYVTQFEDHGNSFLPSIDTNYNDTALDKSVDTSSVDNDDDLVIQLHSGGKQPNQQMDPRIFMKSRSLEVKTWPHGIPEGQFESPKSDEITTSKEQDSSEEAHADAEITTNKNSEDAMLIANQNQNNLDFDYEEPGAAAGELFIDDDVIPTKYLTYPSPVSSVTSYDDNQDDIIRQLDELKSLKSDATLLSNPIVSTELVPNKGDGDPSEDIQRLLVDSK